VIMVRLLLWPLNGFFFFSSRRRHTRCLSDWSSDVCSSDLPVASMSRSIFSVLFLCRARFRLMLATGWGEIQIPAHPGDMLRADGGAFKNKWLNKLTAKLHRTSDPPVAPETGHCEKIPRKIIRNIKLTRSEERRVGKEQTDVAK